ncbi:Flp pilus assembly protein CpaE [Defluviimonas sp. 20V17]|uniref:Pilus assembly protein CpaE n=1 Tax=Allgaiera indica TaxID=765699 RepID=A0AAN4UU39_9RHOB|nr:AAA family ATPase [Allgaiera indica]KDB05456.1 Flp pilus assembly protein CpaE [Defluviimonas sp. 20V17]GHE04687.1 pilus assembly protein CpaE [Allgaiera indica]SDX47246.1 pilus assembly protein CpaE [Allgaiera indica]
MTNVAALQPEPAPIVACTISRDVQNFDLLIEDMEAELGETWGDLSFADASLFLGQPEAAKLEFVALAVDNQDEHNLTQISALIKQAKEMDLKVILIAEEVSPIALHQLLRLGADDFVPYPLPEGALHEAIERVRQPSSATVHPRPDAAEGAAAQASAPSFKATGDRDGVVLPVHGLAGGCGATTFVTNLAWELATVEKKNAPRVCIMDLDFQSGSVSTYLDLPRRDVIFDVLSDTAHTDSDAFLQAMLTFNDKLSVFTAPSEMLPLEIVGSDDIDRLLQMARTNFDFVLIDMPKTVVQWTETVLHHAHVYFAMMELDMRSAQNALRLLRALKAEELPFEKLRFALNRAPKFTDLTGKSRVKRLAESLDIDIELLLPDGGKQILQANDHGLPLAESSAKNPLRKEIQKLAKSLHEHNKSAEAGRS